METQDTYEGTHLLAPRTWKASVLREPFFLCFPSSFATFRPWCWWNYNRGKVETWPSTNWILAGKHKQSGLKPNLVAKILVSFFFVIMCDVLKNIFKTLWCSDSPNPMGVPLHSHWLATRRVTGHRPRCIHWKCLRFWDILTLNNSTDTKYPWM